MKKSTLLLFSLLASALLSGRIGKADQATDPRPLLSFDFAESNTDAAGTGIALKLSPAAAVRQGALVFSASEGSFAEPADDAKFQEWRRKTDFSELSGVFNIRFDKPGRAQLGFFECELDREGKISLTLYAKPTEIYADSLRMEAPDGYSAGKWHEVAFVYSYNMRRWTLFIDGRLAVENDQRILPQVHITGRRMGMFDGAVRDIRLYDAPLESAELAVSDKTAEDYTALQQAASEVSAATGNQHLKAWALELAALAGSYAKQPGKVTVAQCRRLDANMGQARRLAGEMRDAQDTLADSVLASFTVPATTQALFAPDDLPSRGRLSRKIGMYAARGQYEDASILLVPFRPVRKLTLRISDLRDGGKTIPSTEVAVRAVKRWFQNGGAWLYIQGDFYTRLLAPDLLLNDENLVQVDEFRKTNKLLIDSPSGREYVDISKFAYDFEGVQIGNEPVQDAATFQGIALPQPGRNKQLILTVHVPESAEPGFYNGTVTLVADGRDSGTLDLTLRVLPFVLPEARTYYDTGKPYISFVNPGSGGISISHNETLMRNVLRELKKYNLFNSDEISESDWKIRIAKEEQYPLKDLVTNRGAGMSAPVHYDRWFGGPADQVTAEDAARIAELFRRKIRQRDDFLKKHLGPEDFTYYTVFTSEGSRHELLVDRAGAAADIFHESPHARRFSHSMSRHVAYYAADATDMDSYASSFTAPDLADFWHAAGGKMVDYGVFPGIENPGRYRRKIGLDFYKANYDGKMLHGVMVSSWNPFAIRHGSNYRQLGLGLRQKDGFIPRLAMLGVRAGFNDVRYATKLKTLAQEHMSSADIQVAREARRQLLWLERINGGNFDYDAFRAGAAHRIVTLMDLVRDRKGAKRP